MKSNKPQKDQLYFIAIIPPAYIYEEILNFKLYFKENYNSKASLNSPPHITLHMPFKWKEEKEEFLVSALQTFVADYKSFRLTLKNFNCFAPRVIYIDVIANDYLSDVQGKLFKFCKVELNLFNANYKEFPYHPHITLAFRDLKKPMFFKAWEEFKNKSFAAEFDVQNIYLMKHSGRMWEPHQELKLG